MCSSLVLNNQLRFQGYSFYSMIGLTVGGVLNIFLDPLFIFVFDMGIAGAALATALSHAVSFFILLFYALRVGNVRLRISLFRPSLKILKEITIGGLPSLCRQSVMSVAMIVLNTASKPFGDAAIAAMAIVNKVGNFTNSILLGVGQGFQPVCGYNYGAGLYERVKEGFHFCVRSMVLFLILLAVLEYIFAPQIIEFFRRGDPAVTEIGSLALRLRCYSWFCTTGDNTHSCCDDPDPFHRTVGHSACTADSRSCDDCSEHPDDSRRFEINEVKKTFHILPDALL